MPRRRITFRQLETFAAIVREGSFSRAAEALHLTQPAVSNQVRLLSDALGVSLFAPGGKTLALTDAGEEVLRTVRTLEREWDRFESAIAALKGMQAGRLRVALVTTAKHFLPRLLGRFVARYPGIDIELEIANRERIIERLRENRDDLSIMVYPPQDMDLEVAPFLWNELVVVAPLGHPANGRPQRLQDLLGERFILRETGSGSRRIIDEYVQPLGVCLNVKMSLASNEAIRELVAGGLGLSILSRHALPHDLAGEGLCLLDVEGFPLRRPWVVVHRAGRALSLPAQAFREELLRVGGEAGLHAMV